MINPTHITLKSISNSVFDRFSIKILPFINHPCPNNSDWPECERSFTSRRSGRCLLKQHENRKRISPSYIAESLRTSRYHRHDDVPDRAHRYQLIDRVRAGTTFRAVRLCYTEMTMTHTSCPIRFENSPALRQKNVRLYARGLRVPYRTLRDVPGLMRSTV